MRGIKMEIFQDYAYYYNSFYKDKDYRLEAEQVCFLLNKYGGNIGTILNLGCGTGRHDIEIARQGYKCSGVDISPLMIEIAKNNAKMENINIEFFLADIRKYEPEVEYDAVISLFHVMSYQSTNEDIMKAFQTARKALLPGCIFLFDVWYGPGVISDKPGVRVKEIEDGKNRLVRFARPLMHDKKNMVAVNYEILVIDKETDKARLINETHNMRYFFRPELELMLNETGFELIDNLDCRTLGETGYDTWTSYFVARAV